MSHFRSIIVLISYAIAYLQVGAQSLPKKQLDSKVIPSNLKIDGKLQEWDGRPAAYNQATELSYLIANDQDNLYLAFQAKDPDVLTKIMNYGIIITISADKRSKDAISITYPFFQKGSKPYVNVRDRPEIIIGDRASLKAADSIMVNKNMRLEKSAKFIKTKGLPGVDTVISIYNEEGIKVANRFDNQVVYTSEILIPLKYLMLSRPIGGFAFHVEIPGVSNNDSQLQVVIKNGTPTLIEAPGRVSAPTGHLAAVTSTTYFWGEYSLARP